MVTFGAAAFGGNAAIHRRFRHNVRRPGTR